MTQLDSSIEPPGTRPFLQHVHREAQLAQAGGSHEAGHPRAGDDDQVQRERRLVLDVLEPHTLRAPHEERDRVRRVDDVVDLDAKLAGIRPVLLDRLDEHADVVQERTFGRRRRAGVNVEERARRRRAARRRRCRIRDGASLRSRRPRRARRAPRGRGRTRRRSAPRRGRSAGLRRRRPRQARPGASRPGARCASRAPWSRGPSASKSVTFPRRASAPSSVKRSVRSISCMPSCEVRTSAIASRSATQRATWSRVSGLIGPSVPTQLLQRWILDVVLRGVRVDERVDHVRAPVRRRS